MIVDLNFVKKWLRLEEGYTGEDDVLQMLIDNAEQYIFDTVSTFDETDTKQLNKAKLICMILITDWYENREIAGKVTEKLRYSIQSIIVQLEYCYIPEESDI